MRPATALFALLLLPRLALAQLAGQSVYPSPGKALGMVVADAPAKWVVFSQDFLPVNVRVFEADKVCCFEAAPGKYAVIQFPKGADDQPIVSVIVLGGAAPIPPGPSPPPTPPPGPVLEGFAKLAYDEAVKLPAMAKHWPKIAANYESTGAKLAAGGFDGDPNYLPHDAAKVELAQLNRGTVGADREAILPWFVTWQTKADAECKTTADFVTAFSDTARGLKQLRPSRARF